jgi:murein DD-endopeptidase MepM/ murein hydrolase activator NlpD
MPTPRPQPPPRPWRGVAPFALALVLTVAALAPAAAPAAGPRASPALATASGDSPAGAPDRPRVPPLWMPLAGAVVRGFDTRAGPYGPGHRGIDLAAAPGQVVRAPAAGRVVFAGPVAGTTWVSVRVAPGVVATVGPLQDAPAAAGGVAAGAQVRRGAPVGRVAPGHAPGQVPGVAGTTATLHLGVRVDGRHVDPLAYLVDRPRPRLAPLPAPAGLPGA